MKRAHVGLACVLTCAALFTSGCAEIKNAAGSSFSPAKPGVLTVATAFLPAPGFWQGRPPTKGFEAGLAAALAHRFGLSRVHVVQVPFAAIVSGRLHGADMALSQLTPTSERKKHLDFTTPYLNAPAGVLARSDVDASDLQGLQSLRWVVSSLSTLTPTVKNRIRPGVSPLVVSDRTQALRMLRINGADALLLDLPVALGLAHAEPARVHVLGQLSGGEGLAAALPKGSENSEIVDSAIRGLQADGTIDDLMSKWLGESQGDVPLILAEG